MKRLIDANALLEQYGLKDATKYGNKDAAQQAHSYSTLMLYEIADMIEDAPTAYDVEKVVEQLDAYITKIVGRKSKLYQTIIEIVRKGGV